MPKFHIETFAGSSKTSKFMYDFSLESFPLYSKPYYGKCDAHNYGS